MKIDVIQLKRGLKNDLIRVLRGVNKPKEGEPIYEMDTKKLKIGDGINNYEDLEYFSSGGIDIHDVEAGQIIMYDGTDWVAVDLADNHSIEYGQNGLKIAGFTGSNEQQGTMPVVNEGGLNWQQAVTTEVLDAKVGQAQEAAYDAGQYAGDAISAKSDAERAARQAEQFRDATAALLGKKFWVGTQDEYITNVIGKGQLTEGTIYFVYDYDFNTFPNGEDDF